MKESLHLFRSKQSRPNAIMPVRKEGGSLRLCLDPKDLNKNIERNQYYTRTINDLNAELWGSQVFHISGYQVGLLGRSSLTERAHY